MIEKTKAEAEEEATSRLPADEPPESDAGDAVDAFLRLPTAERIAAAAAAGAIVAFCVASGWTLLFRFAEMGGVFVTFTLFGSVLVLVLVALRMLRRLAAPRLTIACAALPLAGLLIELLSNFWQFAMILGAGFMAYAAFKIAMREK